MFDKKEKQLIKLVHVVALGALHIGSDSDAYKIKTKIFIYMKSVKQNCLT